METQAAERPDILHMGWADLRLALVAGWRDMRGAPGFGIFFAGVYVLGGWALWWALASRGQIWPTLVAGAGFPILGPFVACGFYEISRRIERGEACDSRAVLAVVLRQKERQIPSIAAVIAVFFLFWNFLAHMVFALFLGNVAMTNVTTSLAVFRTTEGMAMLAVGGVVGAGFATLLFAVSVVSLPMLLDREVDFVTAMLTSVSVVRESPVVMLGWGALIAVGLFAAMLPGFLGLFVVLPLFGHASWHVYRQAVQWEAPGPQETDF